MWRKRIGVHPYCNILEVSDILLESVVGGAIFLFEGCLPEGE